MPHHQKHRGPAPEDVRLFSDNAFPSLRSAASDLAWLLDRGYARRSSLQLVGDRHNLVARQRTAVSRVVCSEDQRASREQRRVPFEVLRDSDLLVDGYNVLTTVEAALAGGVLLECRDRTIRDMASMHGTWRMVAETRKAITLLGEMYTASASRRWTWLFDRPVSRSGDLARLFRDTASEHGWDWEIDTPDDADPVLIDASEVVASADSEVLDRCGRWHNLAAETLNRNALAGQVIRLFS